MKKHLIAFDLDGTILPRVNELDDRTVAAVRAAKEKGHIIVATSARPFRMLEWVYDRLGLDTAVSTLNGAHVFHPSDPAFPVFECEIERKTVAKILAACAAEGCDPFYVELKEALWYTDGAHNSYYKFHIKTAEPLIHIDHDNLPDTPASRIILSPPTHEASDRITAIVNEQNGLVSTSWDFVPKASDSSGIRMSICPTAADKWNAIKLIAEYYGIPTEDVYTFGDMWNDFGMIENAGHGFALKDSDAERQSKAKNVTRFDCAGCGVAEVIEREILGI